MSEPADDPLKLSQDECLALLRALFPQGLAGAEVLAELAPEGWERSPLCAIFHPDARQVWEESVRMHENLSRLALGRKKKRGEGEEDENEKEDEAPKPPPTLAEIEAEWKPSPVETEEEVTELVGRCLWDLFSDNHSVVADDGREADLGSFRGSAGLIADFVDGRSAADAMAADMALFERMKACDMNNPEELMKAMCAPEGQHGYLDFYLGTQTIGHRCDLGPVYRFLFRRLQAHGLDWIYRFPELHVFRFAKPEKPMDEYDPSAAFGEEQEEAEKNAEFLAMQEKLRADNDAARAEARKGPPPTTVQAYEAVFGRLPEGWPP